MADNTFSIYVPSPLCEQVRAAQDAGRFRVKDVCIAALQAALSPLEQAVLSPLEQAKRELYPLVEVGSSGETATDIEYDLQYQPNLSTAQAAIDNVRDQGGWPISVAPHHGEGFWLLFGWPAPKV